MRRLFSPLNAVILSLAVPSAGLRLPGDDEDATLVLEPRLMILVTRHGHRTPLSRLPFVDDSTWAQFGRCSSPLTPDGKREDHFPCREGELTSLGEAQLTKLGKWLRDRYVTNLKLLDSNYNPEQVVIRSTIYSRTILSAQCLLRGLYPNLDDVSISRAVVGNGRRYVPDAESCPRLLQMYLQLKDQPELHKPLKVPDVLKAKQELEALMKVPSAQPLPSWIMISDNFKSLEELGPISHLFSPALISLTHRMALLGYWRAQTYNREVVRLGLGLLLNEVREAMDSRVSYDTNPKLSRSPPQLSAEAIAAKADTRHQEEKVHALIYSNHDTALVPLLKVLEMYDGEWPKYGANIVMELCRTPPQPKQSSDWYVRIFLDGESKGLLSFEDFKQILAPYTLDDIGFVKGCRVSTPVERRSFFF